MTTIITPNKYTIIHEHKLEGFKASKKFEYSYSTRTVRIVVIRFRSTKCSRYDLKIHGSTKLKELEDMYRLIK